MAITGLTVGLCIVNSVSISYGLKEGEGAWEWFRVMREAIFERWMESMTGLKLNTIFRPIPCYSFAYLHAFMTPTSDKMTVYAPSVYSLPPIDFFTQFGYLPGFLGALMTNCLPQFLLWRFKSSASILWFDWFGRFDYSCLIDRDIHCDERAWHIQQNTVKHSIAVCAFNCQFFPLL